MKNNKDNVMEEKKVIKPFKQQWEEFDFALGFKIALRDFWRELQCSWHGIPFQRTTQEEYLELLHAKRNSKN